jgi:hypothetical protein
VRDGKPGDEIHSAGLDQSWARLLARAIPGPLPLQEGSRLVNWLLVKGIGCARYSVPEAIQGPIPG